MTTYINIRNNGEVETRKEANAMRIEYQLSDPSQKCAKEWKDENYN